MQKDENKEEEESRFEFFFQTTQDALLGWPCIDFTVADADSAAVTSVEVGMEAVVAAKQEEEEEEERGEEFGGEASSINFFVMPVYSWI